MVVDCIIPARSGSKGITSKNIQLLGGHPLLAYSIAAAKVSKKIDQVYVSTDSVDFANIAKKYGGMILYLRPSELARDDSADLEFLSFHLEYLERTEMLCPDLLINLRPTTPLREAKIIDSAIDAFIKDRAATSLRTAHKIEITPYKLFRRDSQYMRPFLEKVDLSESHSQARQIFEDTFIGNGYIDVLDPQLIKKDKLVYGKNIFLYETPNTLDIDSPMDLVTANRMLDSESFDEIREYLAQFGSN